MEILFVAPYAPGPVRVRSHHFIRSLASRGHSITVSTVWTTASDHAALRRLAADGVRIQARQLRPWRTAWNCLRAVPTRAPLQAAYSWHPALDCDMRALLRRSRFDVVHVEHLRGARYALHITRALARREWYDSRKTPRPAVVWDSVDCISHLFDQTRQKSRSAKARLMARFELPRTRSFEASVLSDVDQVLVASDADCRALQAVRHTRIAVLPNGVDVDYFTPPTRSRQPARLVISGKMSYHANATAVLYLVDQIMPRIWAERPEVHLLVVGLNPPGEIRRLGSGRVTVTGGVPDIGHYLRQSTVALAPLVYGAGIQNKVLEAMACATPVVATQVAVSALHLRREEGVVLADDPESFARAVLSLLADPARRARIGDAGRHYVETQHSWSSAASRLESLYEAAIDSLPVSADEHS